MFCYKFCQQFTSDFVLDVFGNVFFFFFPTTFWGSVFTSAVHLQLALSQYIICLCFWVDVCLPARFCGCIVSILPPTVFCVLEYAFSIVCLRPLSKYYYYYYYYYYLIVCFFSPCFAHSFSLAVFGSADLVFYLQLFSSLFFFFFSSFFRDAFGSVFLVFRLGLGPFFLNILGTEFSQYSIHSSGAV